MPEITHPVLDWLNAIPEDMAREAALKNFNEAFPDETERNICRARDFSTALNQAFVWLATPEGREYWAYIHKKLKYQIKL